MEKKDRILVLILFECLSCCFAESGEVRNSAQVSNLPAVSKRFDFPSCSSNFDISENTIIRTQDSKAMGAEFLNEREVNSREDCLKWCCDTNKCDVIVFEEKSPGSCYLFNCGSSDDFKCKFTMHRNYTSAVLSMRNQAVDLGPSKHEEELTRLRLPDSGQYIRSTIAPPVATSVAPPQPPKETIFQPSVIATTAPIFIFVCSGMEMKTSDFVEAIT